jgi:hypothetical protein
VVGFCQRAYFQKSGNAATSAGIGLEHVNRPDFEQRPVQSFSAPRAILESAKEIDQPKVRFYTSAAPIVGSNRDPLPISGQVVSLVFGGLKGVFVVGYWLHSSPGKCSRSQVSKATVRARGIIVGPPRIELYFCIFDRPEQLQVQAFVAQARIEALNEALLHGLSWPNVVNPDPV